MSTVEVDGSEAAIDWNNGELCEADNGAVEAEIKNHTLVADSEAAVGGRASLLGHVNEGRVCWTRAVVRTAGQAPRKSRQLREAEQQATFRGRETVLVSFGAYMR